MHKVFDLVVDTTQKITNKSIQVNTNDLQTVKFNLNITQDGKVIDLTGATVRIAIVKPDKTTVFQDCTITSAVEGQCEVVLNTQAYVIEGMHIVEVMVYYTAEMVSVTSRFPYTVRKGVLNDSAVESTNDWQAINQSITDAENILIDLRENGTAVDAFAREELNSVNTKLAEKADESEVRKRSVPITLNDADSEFLSAIEGGEGTTFNLESIPRDYSVSPIKTDFFNLSNNLFDKSDITIGQSIDTDGTIYAEPNHWVMNGFIKVLPGEKLSSTSGVHRLGYYTSDGVFVIRSGTLTGSISVPTQDNIALLKIATGVSPDNFMVNRGGTLLPYQAYDENKIKLSTIPTIGVEQASFFKKTHNIFDKSKAVIGKAIDPLNGDIITDENLAYSDYIEVTSGESYRFDNAIRFIAYNANKQFSSAGTASPYQVPAGIKFIRLIMNKDKLDKVQYYKGTDILPYEKYGYVLDKSLIPSTIDSVSNQNKISMINLARNVVVDVKEYNTAEFDFDFGRGSFRVEGSKDGTTFETLNMTKKDSGNSYERISVKGVYSVDIAFYTHVRCVTDFYAEQPFNMDLHLSTASFVNEVNTKPNKLYAPSTPTLNYELTNIGSKVVCDLSKDGTIYAYEGNTAYKSTDRGATWINLGSPRSNGLDTLRKLDNGALFTIIRTSEGITEYWLTDENEQNWTMTYSHTTQGVFGAGYGLDIYQNIILFAPYQGVKVPELIQIHYSKDYGKTFRPIFDSPIIETWHMHDVAYDPYASRIYMVSGDGTPQANIYWTDNEGGTWQKADPNNQGRSQFTSINPIPGYVLFGTDESRVRGVFRHPRGSGSSENNFVLDPAFHDIPPGSTEKNIVVHGNAQYWDTNNAAFFMANIPPNVYATKDGFNYYTMLELADGTISNLTRVDVNGKMAMNYKLDNVNYLMLIDKVEWVEI